MGRQGATVLAGLAGLGVGPACVLADDYRDGAGPVSAGGTSAGGVGGVGGSGAGGTAAGGAGTGGTGGTTTGGTSAGGAGAGGPCTGQERSCRELQDCGASNGQHEIATDLGRRQVQCDMDLDGGGWTLVGRIGGADRLAGGLTAWQQGFDGDALVGSGPTLALMEWRAFDAVAASGVALRQRNESGQVAYWVLRSSGALLSDFINEAQCASFEPDRAWFGSSVGDPEWSVEPGGCELAGPIFLGASQGTHRRTGAPMAGTTTAFAAMEVMGARDASLFGAPPGAWAVGATLWLRECRVADCAGEPGGAGAGGTGGTSSGVGGTGAVGSGGSGATGSGGAGGSADVLGQPVDLGGTPTPAACSVIEVAGGTVAVLCMGSTYLMSGGTFTRVSVAENTTGIAAAGGALPLWLGLDSGVLARCPPNGAGCLRTTLPVAGNVGWPAWDATDQAVGHLVGMQQVLRFPLAGGASQPLSTASAERSRGVVSLAGLHWLESASGAWSLRRADRATGALSTLYPVPTPRGIATVGYGLSGAERAVALLAYCANVGAVVMNSGTSGALPGSDACNGDVRLHWVDPDPPRAFWVSDGDLVMADADAAALAPSVVAPGVAPVPAYVPLAASGDHVYLIANERIVRVRVR